MLITNQSLTVNFKSIDYFLNLMMKITMTGETLQGSGDDLVYHKSDECYSLTSQKRTFVTHMSVGRMDAASIVLNGTTLWVTGGRGNNGQLASTEKITMEGTMPGPDLIVALQDHAMVAINSTVSMIIGGWDGSNSASTFYFDHIKSDWINGPNSMQAKYLHAAGVVTDEVTNENFVAVTGGHFDYDDLDSTEILQDGKWVQGKTNDTVCNHLEISGYNKNTLVARAF